MKSYTQVYRFGHQVLVPTLIGDASLKLFLLDTGGFNNLISPGAATEVTKVHGDSSTIVEGISGSVQKVYSAEKAVIQFGEPRQEIQDLLAFELTQLRDSTRTGRWVILD